jgi:hypothetical protein
MSLLGSPERDLLEKDGYAFCSRTWLGGDGTLMMADAIGVGLWAAWVHSTAKPSNGGPELCAAASFVGTQLPLVVRAADAVFFFAPRMGLGIASLQQGWMSRASSVKATSYGFDAGLYAPGLHVGLSAGALWAKGPRPGDVGRDYNFGGVVFLLSGVIDG